MRSPIYVENILFQNALAVQNPSVNALLSRIIWLQNESVVSIHVLHFTSA